MIYGFTEQLLQLDKIDMIQLFYFVFGKKKPQHSNEKHEPFSKH